MTDQQQQLSQSSERILKLFLDESVNNKSISLQLWFNRSGKLQFRLSTASSRRENRRTTANTDDEPVPVALKPLQRDLTRPQPTVTTRSTTAANKKRKKAPTISPTADSAQGVSPEIPRCVSQQSQHTLSFLDANERDQPPSDEECSDEMTIPEIQESGSIYISPFFNKNRFQELSSPPVSEIDVPDDHQTVPTISPKGHQYAMICNICIKPHKKLVSKYAGSSSEGTWRKVEYWDDIDAPPCVKYKCLCYAENECNCVHNERRNEILPPKPDDA